MGATPASIPGRFEPKFWCQADQRFGVVKEIRTRYEQLKADTGADSYQKDLLCQRAVFVATQLETMEIAAAESGEFEAGVYTQMVNSLSGLLKALGLERRTKKVVDLKNYVKGAKQ